MPTDQGYSNQKKKGTAQFETVHYLGSERYGKAISQKGLFEITPETAIVSVTPIDGIDGQIQYYNIEIPAHGASVGNVLRITSGVLFNFEFDILQVIDADNFYILNINGVPSPGDLGTIMGWVSAKFSPAGDINVMVAPSPIIFNKDGLEVEVTEDTVLPANNLPLPSQMFVYIDGIQYPVSKDTGTPSNTVSIPVELTGASGPINITAGDLNVQLTDLGANFDRTRIGDGTGNQWGFNVSSEGLVHDQNTLDAVTASTLGVSQPANSSTTPLAGGATFTGTAMDLLGFSTVNVSIFTDQISAVNGVQIQFSPNGVNWDDTHSTLISVLTGFTINHNHPVENRFARIVYINGATPQGVFRLTTILKKQPVCPSAIPLSMQITDHSLAQTTASVIHGRTSTGAFVDVKASASGAIATSPEILSPTYQEILNLTTVAQTFTAPVGSKWIKVMAEDTNTANIRVKVGAAATISSGMQFQPGRSEDYMLGSNVSVIAESGINQKISVQFGA